MIARLAGLFTICMLTSGAALAPVLEVAPTCRPSTLENEKTDPLAPEWEVAEAWGWVSRVATAPAKHPAPATADDGSQHLRSALGLVRVALAVPRWLEAIWTALTDVLRHGSAWSVARLFSQA